MWRPDTLRGRQESRGHDPPAHSDPTELRTSSPTEARAESNYVSTEEWTSRLIDRGFSIAEAAAIRGLDVEMIVRHLTWMVRRGHPLRLETVLDSDTIAAWEVWWNENGETAPKGPENAIQVWPLFLACRVGRS